MKAQAILNPKNANLDEFTDIARQICDAGGKRLARECQGLQRTYSVLPVSAVIHTTAGEMQPNIELVLHVIRPELAAYTVEGTFQKILITTFLKSLWYASDVLQATSLAIPAQSLGVLGTPPLSIVTTLYSALKVYTAELQRNETTPTLRTVYLVSDHLGNTSVSAYPLFQLLDSEPPPPSDR